MYAAGRGHARVVKTLIRARANVDFQDDVGAVVMACIVVFNIVKLRISCSLECLYRMGVPR
jgi:hypothetical protein